MIAAGNRVMIKPSELVPHFAALLKELVAQGAVVFIMTMVQGWGPPSSIIPGIERFAGLAGGLLSCTWWPSSSRPRR